MLHHEVDGDGPPLLLVHPGIADSRIWEPQWRAPAYAGYRRIRCDLPGFGRTPAAAKTAPAAEVVALLDGLGARGAGVVGCSVGGRVALEVAVARPDLVAALVLVGAGLPGWEWGPAMERYDEAETAAVLGGDLDAAVEENLRMWVDGDGRDGADPATRSAVATMLRPALEQQAPFWEGGETESLVRGLADRLGEISCPTLVVVGEHDVPDIHRIAERLASSIPGARLERIAGCAHVPSLEQPAAFDALVVPFLATALAASR